MTSRIFCSMLVLVTALFTAANPLTAQENPAKESKGGTIDIQGDVERRAEDIRQGKPIPKIEDPDVKMPELPKPITRKRLGASEELQIARLESENIDAKTTETEKNIKKDLLARDSNIKF